ncbi:MAG: DUF2505 family protein [Deltaproteobacteria bacterium]|nr:DUF2505 family protein [Deltaproteobacteria bacterium]
MTPFSFQHVFRAPSPAEILAAYWNPGHQLEQDRKIDVIERTVLELSETASELRRTSRIVPRRQLPALVRPLISGQLHYVETCRWRKHDDEIDIEIRPSILRGRALITALYRLSPAGTGLIQRSYTGSVSVDVALISSRIERGIVAEFERSMPLAAAVTQDWLDRPERPLSARA